MPRRTGRDGGVDLRNQADNLLFQTDKQLKEFGDKVQGDGAAKVENAAEKLREALKSNSSEQIRAAVETLNAAWNEASTQMYESGDGGGSRSWGRSRGGPRAGLRWRPAGPIRTGRRRRARRQESRGRRRMR